MSACYIVISYWRGSPLENPFSLFQPLVGARRRRRRKKQKKKKREEEREREMRAKQVRGDLGILLSFQTTHTLLYVYVPAFLYTLLGCWEAQVCMDRLKMKWLEQFQTRLRYR